MRPATLNVFPSQPMHTRNPASTTKVHRLYIIHSKESNGSYSTEIGVIWEKMSAWIWIEWPINVKLWKECLESTWLDPTRAKVDSNCYLEMLHRLYVLNSAPTFKIFLWPVAQTFVDAKTIAIIQVLDPSHWVNYMRSSTSNSPTFYNCMCVRVNKKTV